MADKITIRILPSILPVRAYFYRSRLTAENTIHLFASVLPFSVLRKTLKLTHRRLDADSSFPSLPPTLREFLSENVLGVRVRVVL